MKAGTSPASTGLLSVGDRACVTGERIHADAPNAPEADAQSFAELRSELERLRAENARLLRLLDLTPEQARRPGPAQAGLFDARPGPVTGRSEPERKVAFYRALFNARRDVYATRWENARTGQSGWLPAVRGGWRKGQRAQDRDHLPLSDTVLTAHLSGEVHLGLYPMLDGDSCSWLAADFDGPSAMLDALAYVKAARAVQVPAALEVSRSGIGAHVWVFFTAPVPAEAARRLGAGLLHEAIATRGRTDLSSYDRLFPSQDVLPTGGTGNLIAAPLHGASRRSGATVFLDLSTMEPHEDQWAYLSALGRMSPRDLTRSLRRVKDVAVGVKVTHVVQPSSSKIRPPAPARISVRLAAGVHLPLEQLTPTMHATLKHAASMTNPAFYDRQRRRMTTWNIPRFLRLYDETVDGELVLPRGLAETTLKLLQDSGSHPDTTDSRSAGSPHPLSCSARLTVAQRQAVDAVLAHEHAVLVAPPGAGKTVMACAVIATHQVSTLVLVDRKTLADQWRSRIQEHLGAKAGQIGGGRSKTRGVIDVAMLQTLARRDDVAELTAQYGLVVVDECHHVPAAAFEAAVKQIPARRWLGLTATPYRRDRLDDLIGLLVGPTRHTLQADTVDARSASDGQLPLRHEGSPPAPVLTVHPTGFLYSGAVDVSVPGGINAVYKELVADSARNVQIVDDVDAALGRGRRCLVLTQWTAHVEHLADLLRMRGHDPVVLRGGLGAKARKAALQRLEPSDSEPMLVVATGPYVGEGFDIPALDTLFLAAPIAFRGRLVQYVGRVVRTYPGKDTAEVHDYHDSQTGVLASSLSKRAAGYTSLGFPDPRRL